jgi:squalene synthase HpnC
LVTPEDPQNRPESSALAEPRCYLALAAQHYENFPVGSWLLPRRARLHLHRIYAFARTADDLADELRDPAALARFRSDWLEHAAGRRDDVSLFRDLCATVRECDLPIGLLTDLLDAFAQDLEVTRYDEGGLLGYCRKSADPIGRLVLRVCGYCLEDLDQLSDRICTALQLVNHLQDMGSDLRERGRVYFPTEDLRSHGVTEDMIAAERATVELRSLVRRWVDRLETDLLSGFELTRRVRGRLRWELRAIIRGAAAVLRRIRAVDFDVLGGRVHLNRPEQIIAVFGGLLPWAPASLRGRS